MTPQNIGKVMTNGWAGGYARQPDMIIDTHPLGGDNNIAFGTVLMYGTNGAVVPADATTTAATFLGIAAREVKSALSFTDQNRGVYAPNDAVAVFKRGCINVSCNVGTPAAGGAVYLRIKDNASIPAGVVGGLEAAADGDNTVQLTCCRWNGAADANGVAELCILTRNN